jgi:hypothetical protein
VRGWWSQWLADTNGHDPRWLKVCGEQDQGLGTKPHL